ncbi:MAG: hypothetical protein ACI8RT_000860 [Candidatus Azotimanducaceae bacterium]
MHPKKWLVEIYAHLLERDLVHIEMRLSFGNLSMPSVWQLMLRIPDCGSALIRWSKTVNFIVNKTSYANEYFKLGLWRNFLRQLLDRFLNSVLNNQGA